ncbi:MAG: methyltransferase domain-containing protein, partial [Xanthomonadales bacterium]|nr:methyltransferase domain-containing protein [Xanthomonadales bacterium]
MAGDAATTTADQVAPSCCSTFYEQDWVRELAGDSFHPGGEALSRRTVEAMALPAGASMADLGCGTGTTALLLAGSYGLHVTGLDLSEANLERARTR